MIETKYVWTVYCNGELFDVMTEEELRAYLRDWVYAHINWDRRVVEF